MTDLDDDKRDENGRVYVELQRCDNCEYSRYAGRSLKLFCHRHAPRPMDVDSEWQWCTVSPDDWCGEWKEDTDT